jgi:hypothetical protein
VHHRLARGRIGSGRTVVLLASAALAHCSWTRALDSDPAFYAPGQSEVAGSADATPVAESGDALATSDGAPAAMDSGDTEEGQGAMEASSRPSCDGDPPYDPALMASGSTSPSHRAGEACLTSCHATGGTARLTFVAAGTVYQSWTSRTVVAAGNTIDNIGSTTVTIDPCGNFYAIAAALTTGIALSQPYVQSPTLRKMDRPMTEPDKNMGDCNQSGCHDLSSRSNWGIFY